MCAHLIILIWNINIGLELSDKSQKLLAKAYHDNAPHVRVITLIKEKERQRKAEGKYKLQQRNAKNTYWSVLRFVKKRKF